MEDKEVTNCGLFVFFYACINVHIGTRVLKIIERGILI